MPQITYLLVQEEPPTAYEILCHKTTEDIPNTGNIQMLLDEATVAIRDLFGLGPGQRIIVETWKLINPVAGFCDRPLGDIETELPEMNRDFFLEKVIPYSPEAELARLQADDGQGRVLVVFSIPENIWGPHGTESVPADPYTADQPTRKRSRSSSIEDHGRPVKRHPVYPEDVTQEILSHWLPLKRALPPINELRRFLDTPLDERAKIPVDQYQFNSLISDVNGIRKEGLEVLFRVDNKQHAVPIYHVVSSALHNKPLLQDGTEHAFTSFWDHNVGQIIQVMIPNGVSFRGGSCPMNNDSRPSFGFLFDNICAFRGEERSSIELNEPRDELGVKMAWTYDPAPYVLGYYATGTHITLVAICRPRYPQGSPEIVDLTTPIDLRLKSNRIVNLIRMINLCSLIIPITSAIGRRTTPEFTPLCSDGKVTEVCGKHIKKTFEGPERYMKLGRLKSTYDLLKAKAVPNIDSISPSFADDPHSAVVFLEPRGISVLPMSSRELLEAVGCVLEALVVMHEGPKPIFHRDIRWPNIVQRADDPTRWVLIDWEDAATPPTIAATHLRKSNHAPGVFLDNHGPEVDLWAVGMLILERSGVLFRLPSESRVLGETLQSGTLSALEALERVNAIKELL